MGNETSLVTVKLRTLFDTRTEPWSCQPYHLKYYFTPRW